MKPSKDIVASQIGGTSEGEVDAAFQQLALVESAGEALPVLPLGVLSIAMLWRRWRRGSESSADLTPA